MAAKKRKKRKAAKAGKKRKVAKAEVAHGSKSGFVRAHPGMPAAELSALAKKQGFALSPGLIYNIRANDKRRGGSATGRASRSKGTNESQLRSLVMRMGLDNADAVFTELRAQMKKLA